MSETKTTAKFSFKDSLEQRLSKTFADIDPSVADSDMQALANGIVANGQIYPVVPVEATKIEKITIRDLKGFPKIFLKDVFSIRFIFIPPLSMPSRHPFVGWDIHAVSFLEIISLIEVFQSRKYRVRPDNGRAVLITCYLIDDRRSGSLLTPDDSIIPEDLYLLILVFGKG